MAKHPGGRPLKFKTPEELQEKIDEYFDKCKNNKEINNEGKFKNQPLMPTIAGLAYHLGIDRQTIYNYENRDKFFDTIKKAKDYIISRIESKLANVNGNISGAIFLAKNYGYTDKKEIEHSGGVKVIQIPESMFDDSSGKD